MAFASDAPRRKLIAFGWDFLAVTPEEVLANADAINQTGLDGVLLMVEKSLADGRKLSFRTVMNDPVWPATAFADKVDVFRQIVQHPALKESFLCALWAPKKRLSWQDDGEWERFSANMAEMARLAKDGGLRGIMVDVEDYPRARQYFWCGQDGDYGAVAQIARRRGAQVGREMFAAYPDMVLISTWFLSLTTDYFAAPDPIAAARANNDLWPAFVNGLLDVIPPTARMVDGNEHAYSFEYTDNGYSRSACHQRVGALGLVAPENRGKYRAQMDVGFGFYMDCYRVPPGNHYHRAPVNGSRLAHFNLNLREAVSAADSYVWLYGEGKTWIHWKDVKNKAYVNLGTWEELMPGLSKSLVAIKDPLGEIQRGLADFARLKEPVSLVTNTEYVARGAFDLDGLNAGERFLVTVSALGEKASVRLYWKRGSVWQWEMPRHHVLFPEHRPGVWRKGHLVVRVPDSANAFGIQLLNGEPESSEKVQYDDLQIYRLD